MDNEQKLIYSISRLNTEVRQVLESSFPLVWVEGEISNLSTPRSGHMYFSLKDAYAQTRCAMFRMKRQLLRFQPAEGTKVLLRARITLYEARGDFQLVVEHMEPAGEGQLRLAIEALQKRLDAEGLFDPAHKKDLPALPQTVGVITSPTGAAITDILHVFKRRFPAIRIIVYPVPVQGENAAAEIVQMLKLAEQRKECDLFILARGGGSLEDLMAFNDEQLARTLFSLQTPVISAVGHEIDTSISDFVADRRAPTPSAAAELASPDQDHLIEQVHKLFTRLTQLADSSIRHQQLKYQHLQQRLALQSPQRLLQNRFQALDNLERRLNQSSPVKKIEADKAAFNNLLNRLNRVNPALSISDNRQRVSAVYKQLEQLMGNNLNLLKNKLQNNSRMLESVSPLATLSRGYAIVKDTKGAIIKNARNVKPGDKVSAQLAEGNLHCQVESIEN